MGNKGSLSLFCSFVFCSFPGISEGVRADGKGLFARNEAKFVKGGFLRRRSRFGWRGLGSARMILQVFFIRFLF